MKSCLRGLGAAMLLLVGLAGATEALAKKKPAGLVDRLPTAERVAAGYAPDRVRQAAACEVMAEAVKHLYIGNLRIGSSPERTRYGDYFQCRNEVRQEAVAAGADRDDFSGKVGALVDDPAFSASVAERYLTPADLADWRSRVDLERELKAQQDAQEWQMLLVFGLPYLAGFLFSLWILIRALRPWHYDSGTGLLRFGGRTYTIYRRAGVVAQAAEGRTRTHVPGSQTIATNAYGHSHVVSSTPGYSYTTLHETIHLLDKDGDESVLRLTDWSISARGGHQLGALWAIRKGRKTGPYLRIWNFSIDETTSNTAQLNRMFGLGFWNGLLALPALFGIEFVLVLVLLVLNRSGIMQIAEMPIIPFAGAILTIVAIFVLHFRLRNSRRARFDQEVAAPIRERNRAEARAAADRVVGPISRAD